MKKTYKYRDAVYKRKVKVTGAYAGIIALAAIGYFLFSSNHNYLLIAVAVVGLYTYWETYVSLANPQEVTIDDKSITFAGCGKVHTYQWKDIYSFKVKEFVSARKVFVRINDAGIKKGRYWINCRYFNDTDQLYMFFRDKEYEIHPNSIKSYARRSNEKKFEERKVANEQKKLAEEKRLAEKSRIKAEKKKAKQNKKDK